MVPARMEPVILRDLPEPLDGGAEPDADVDRSRSRQALLDEREPLDHRDERSPRAHEPEQPAKPAGDVRRRVNDRRGQVPPHASEPSAIACR